MKYSAPLLALTATALGNQIQERGGGYDDYEHTTLTTYTTVTTCPVTSTYTQEGTTYCVTDLTTSTIVVTECYGCGVKTVPGEDTTVYDHQTEYATRYTTCPVTATVTEAGTVYTKTYLTTKVIDQVVPTTYVESVQLPDTTVNQQITQYSTRTSLCPVTETTYVNGQYVTKVYTTTSLIVEKVPVTAYETVKNPDTTVNREATQYLTKTSLCPVTSTIVENGKTITQIFTTTSLIVEKVPVTEYETVKNPDVTQDIHKTVYTTSTSLCPYTEYVTIGGETQTRVFTSTKIIVTQVPSVITQVESVPGATETQYEVQKSTRFEVIPITNVETIQGEAVTQVFTSTKIVIEKVATTLEAVETIYLTNSLQEVQTQYSKVFVTVGGGTVTQNVPGKPTTYVVPQTSVISQPPVTVTSEQPPPATSAPVEVPTGAGQANKAPAIALMAGIAGALALL